MALKDGMLLHSKETLNELAQVFTRPKFDKYITLEKRLNAISEFEKRSFLTDVTVRILACRDIKDNKFLELAISGNSLSIISGDNDLLVLHPFQNISILTPSEFLENF